MNESAVMNEMWQGDLALGTLSAVFVGASGATRMHHSLVHKIVMGADVVGAPECGRGNVWAIRSGTSHRICVPQRDAVIVFLDPRRYRWADVMRLAQTWRHVSRRSSTVPAMLEDLERVPAVYVDERLRVAMALLSGSESVHHVARCVGLSASRLTHLMSEQLCAPPSQWRKWLRVQQAVDLVACGSSVTDAAYEAGFADSAHLSRACSAAIGIAPSALRGCRVDNFRASETCKTAWG